MTDYKEEIDKIVFRCFEQGRYWGTGVGENIANQEYKPEEPIDRTEAVGALYALINQKEKEAQEQELFMMAGILESRTKQGSKDWVVYRIKQLKEELNKKGK